MDWINLIQTLGLPVVILIVVGSVFLRIVDRNQNELSELNRWVRDAMIKELQEFRQAARDLIDEIKESRK